MEGFRMNLDTAEEFFKRCIERKADTEEARIVLLKELQAELRVIKLTEADLERMARIKGDTSV